MRTQFNTIPYSGLLYTAVVVDERLLTVKEVAALLKAHEETVRRWLREGVIKGVRPAGKRFGWRIRESELRRFLDGGPE